MSDYDAGDRLVNAFQAGVSLARTDSKNLAEGFVYPTSGVTVQDLTRTLQTYDVLGRLRTQTAGAGTKLTLTYGYDATAREISVTDKQGGGQSVNYDLADRIVSEAAYGPDGLAVFFTFDYRGDNSTYRDDHVKTIIGRNGISITSPAVIKADFQYDDLGREIERGWHNPTLQYHKELLTTSYYNSRTNLGLVSQETRNGNVTPAPFQWGYSGAKYDYNSFGQMFQTSSLSADGKTWSQPVETSTDQVGNDVYPDQEKAKAPGYREYTQSDGPSKEYRIYYDGNSTKGTEGNVTKVEHYTLNVSNINPDATAQYDYDYRKQLVAVSTSTSSPIQYTYDTFGRMVDRNVSNGLNDQRTVYTGSETYADANPDGTIRRRYLYGPDGQVLARIGTPLDNPTDVNGAKTLFYLTDRQNSVLQVVAPDGDTIKRIRYEGLKEVAHPAVSGFSDPFSLGGQRRDDDVNLTLMDGQWYSPTLGRYLTEGGHGIGLNPYPVAGDSVPNATLSSEVREQPSTGKAKDFLDKAWDFLNSDPMTQIDSAIDAYDIYYRTVSPEIDRVIQGQSSVEDAFINFGGEFGRQFEKEFGVSPLDAINDPIVGQTVDRFDSYFSNWADELTGGGVFALRKELWGETATRNHFGPWAKYGRFTGMAHRALLSLAGGGPAAFQQVLQMGRVVGAADRAQTQWEKGDYLGATISFFGGVGQFDPQVAKAAQMIGSINAAREAIDRGDEVAAAFRVMDAGGAVLDQVNPCNLAGGQQDLMRAWHFARTAQHTWEGVSAVQRGDWGAAFTQGSAAWSSWGQFRQPCFAAGMPVRTPDGSKLVENVIVGDVLLSRDEFDPNGDVLGKVVEQVFVRQAKVLELGMKGRVIRTTAEHPFFAEGRGWVPAGVLEVGQKLWSEASGWLSVESVTDTGKEETVYNFRVADFHTYFVGCDEWGWSLWAHNSYISRRDFESDEEFLKYVRPRVNASFRADQFARQLHNASGLRFNHTIAVMEGRLAEEGPRVIYIGSNGTQLQAEYLNAITAAGATFEPPAMLGGIQYNAGRIQYHDGEIRFRVILQGPGPHAEDNILALIDADQSVMYGAGTNNLACGRCLPNLVEREIWPGAVGQYTRVHTSDLTSRENLRFANAREEMEKLTEAVKALDPELAQGMREVRFAGH